MTTEFKENSMNKCLLISGGCERKNGYELGEGKYYDRARLLKLDLVTEKLSILLEKSVGGNNYPDVHPNLQFTSCCLRDDILWLPTDTEVYKYTYPDLKLLNVYSHPYFHNIHAVNVYDGKVYVSSTGLDLVVEMDLEGNVIRLLNTEGKDVWHRFSKDIDYRLVHSTRPHDCHPNFVFYMDNSPWVTRCRQQDVVCLENANEKIELTNPEKRISVHDGVNFNQRVYFTMVDGHVVVVDPKSKAVVENINVLESMDKDVLGWARGLSITNEGIAYIGFSRLRRTRMKEKLAWLVKGQINKMHGVPASVVAFDLNKKRLIRKYDLPLGVIDAIYGVEMV